MALMTRRFFLLSTAALSASCAAQSHAEHEPSNRKPVVGQTWRYSKQDLFSGSHVDFQLDRVAAVGTTVEIASNVEAVKAVEADGSTLSEEILKQYAANHDKPAGALPSEIQDPWGMILADPHWGQVQVYESPIPLWPALLQPGWRTHFKTKYKTPSHQKALLWDQTMRAREWESVTVPAGQFNALRFTNMINFTSSDMMRTVSSRTETIWFAPEVGRWVARESSGSYYPANSAIDTPISESSYRWELIGWS